MALLLLIYITSTAEDCDGGGYLKLIQSRNLADVAFCYGFTRRGSPPCTHALIN